MSDGRKYGDGDSHPIPVWNGIFDHYGRIGIALWVFLWLIDRIPKNSEQDGVGKVLGGRPVKISEIVETMRGATYRGVRRQLDALEELGYIARRRTPYGFVVEVRNSRKWNIWKPKETGQKGQSLQGETGQKGQSGEERVAKKGAQSGQKGQNKEDTAIHSSKETQQKAAASSPDRRLWNELGISAMAMRSLSPAFRELCEGLYAARGSQTLNELAGLCMDLWQEQGGKIPAPFAKAAAELRERRKENPQQSGCERPELEELPWARR